MHLLRSIAIRLNLELMKTRPKQLLGSLPLVVTLPALCHTGKYATSLKEAARGKHSSLYWPAVCDEKTGFMTLAPGGLEPRLSKPKAALGWKGGQGGMCG